jgi:predicted MFS family arabinose efflux permease
VAASRDAGALDWRGLVLASSGTLCLLNGLVQLHGGASLSAAGLLLAAALALVLFLRWQRHLQRHGREPLMNLALFRHRNFVMGAWVAWIYGMALFGSTYLLPVYLQLGLGLSPSHVGTVLLPAGLVLAVTIAGVGRLADRQPVHGLVSIGLVLLAASFLLMFTVHLDSPIALLLTLAVLGRIGLGFILPSLNLGAMRGLPKDLIPQGSSSINFVRMLGGASGVSLCGIFLEWRIAVHGDALTRAQTSAARLAAFNESFVLLGSLCVLALLAAWRLREPKPEMMKA